MESNLQSRTTVSRTEALINFIKDTSACSILQGIYSSTTRINKPLQKPNLALDCTLIMQKYQSFSFFSHLFAEKIVAHQRWILGNWRRFLFIRWQSTITYLTFYTSVTGWDIHARIYSLFCSQDIVNTFFMQFSSGLRIARFWGVF